MFKLLNIKHVSVNRFETGRTNKTAEMMHVAAVRPNTYFAVRTLRSRLPIKIMQMNPPRRIAIMM